MEKIIESMQENMDQLEENIAEIELLNDEAKKEQQEINKLTDVCVEQLRKMKIIMNEQVTI